MAEQITVRSDGGAPATSSSSGSVSVEKSRQQLAVEGLKERLKGRPVSDDMLRAIVARRERQEAQAHQKEVVRQAHETTTAVSKRDNGGESGQAGARATLLGKMVETHTADKLTPQQRALVTSDPHAPAVLPPVSTPQVTEQQARQLLSEKMFAYVLPPAGLLTIAGYAETLSQRPATVPGEQKQGQPGDQSAQQQQPQAGTRQLQQPADHLVRSESAQQQTEHQDTGGQGEQRQQGAPNKEPTARSPLKSAALADTAAPPTDRPVTPGGNPTETTGTGQPTRPTTGTPQPAETPLRTLAPLHSSMDQPAAAPSEDGTPAGIPNYGNAPPPKTPKATDRGSAQGFKATTGSGPQKPTGPGGRPGGANMPTGNVATGLRANPMGLEGSNSAARLSVSTRAAAGPKVPIRPKGITSGVSAFDDVSMTTTDHGNAGGGIDTTTSWNGMSFNWDAFFIKFMFKFEKDDAEARRLEKEIRNLMHKVAVEGIKAKIELEKMNQAFERAEAAMQLGSALKGVMDSAQKGQSDKMFGKNADATAEAGQDKKGPLDDQIANLTKGFQPQGGQTSPQQQQSGTQQQRAASPGQQPNPTQSGTPRQNTAANTPTGGDIKSGPSPVLWLSQTQRQSFAKNDPQGFSQYESLMKQRLSDAGTLGQLGLIGTARDRAPPGSALQRELSAEYDRESAKVNGDIKDQNGTRTGRANANQRQRMMQQALIHAFASMAENKGQYSMGGISNLFRQTREYNDRLLLQKGKSDDQLDGVGQPRQSALGPNGPQGPFHQTPGQQDSDQERRVGGSRSLKHRIGISDGNDTSNEEQSDLDKILKGATNGSSPATPQQVQPLLQNFVTQLGNNDPKVGAARLESGLKALGVPADVAHDAVNNPDFLKAVTEGYANQLQRTQQVADGQSPTQLSGSSPTENIGHALGGSLAGQALTDSRKEHLPDVDKNKKIDDMLGGGGGIVAGMADVTRRDAEKANAEAIQAAQKGAGEMDARIRQNYMRAQGLFNQMTHILQMSRRGHH